MANAKTGASTFIGFTMNSSIDSAIAAGAGDKLLVKTGGFQHSKGSSELVQEAVGSGANMQLASDPGSSKPTLTVPHDMKYDDAAIGMLAQFFGLESIGPVSSGYYPHSFSYNPNRNTNFGCLALQATDSDIFEYVNCAVTALTINAVPNQYLEGQFSLLATAQKSTGTDTTTNSAASLATVTEPANTSLVTVRPIHKMRINAQAGAALADSDALQITKASIELGSAQELVDEMKGSDGNGAPRNSGVLTAKITATFKKKTAMVYNIAFNAGTLYKGDIEFSIGSYSLKVLFPKLQIVGEPSYTPSGIGENEETVTFTAIFATSNPTGMFSGYPAVVVKNQRATAYLK